MPKFLAAAFILAAAVFPASAAPVPPTEVIPLVPDSTFKVEIDGAPVPTAETYMVGNSSLLILGCNLKDPILVATSDRTVRYFPGRGVIRDAEGNVSVKDLRRSPSAATSTARARSSSRRRDGRSGSVPSPPSWVPRPWRKSSGTAPTTGTGSRTTSPTPPPWPT